jgi:glutamate formiminotransferase
VRTRPGDPDVLECVVNVSEGRDAAALATLADAAGPLLLDLHRDADHNRSVFTLAGRPDAVDDAARALATATLARLDLRTHVGAHPRLGVLDVVPFVPYARGVAPPADLTAAAARRDDFARWLAAAHDVPTFLYGPLPGGSMRTLPDVRRHAFGDGPSALHPDFGPPRLSLRSGATAVGARSVLVAYNVWVDSPAVARVVAPQVRSPQVRALGLTTGVRAQVSCNLIDPVRVGPAAVYDAVSALVEDAGGTVEGAELVGLIPEVVLAAVPAARRRALGLSEEATVEARLPPGRRG